MFVFLLWLLVLSLTKTFCTQIGNESQSLLWGPYRPNLYFGLRPKLPHSLMTGLMWFDANDYQSINNIRHTCDQADGLETYGWTHFDARQGGVQVLEDGRNNIRITTEFLKVPVGNPGGSWAARIRGSPVTSHSSHTSILFYLGLEGQGALRMETRGDEVDSRNEILFSGSSRELGDFVIRFVDSDARSTHYLGRHLPVGMIWRAEEIIVKSIVEWANTFLQAFKDSPRGLPDPSLSLRLPDDIEPSSNLFTIQKFFQGNFQLDIFFESGSTVRGLSSKTLDHGIPSLIAAYDAKFKAVLPVPTSYATSKRKSLEQFSKAITSNLLGGIGYFYGTSKVASKSSYEWDSDDVESEVVFDQKMPQLKEARSLFSATPSRSFFPRGFYWDEGFHILHISEWDVDLSLDILQSWTNLIDDDGWVAREQILGEEARSKVPEEFQTQVPQFANPPTLIMGLIGLIARIDSGATNESMTLPSNARPPQVPVLVPDATEQVLVSLYHTENNYARSPDSLRTYIRSIYGPLKKHYHWFRRTQRGHVKQYSRLARSRTEAYRWRGRSETHVLTSGMDDYPRGPPHTGELHLDLICWMGYFTRTMAELARFIGQPEDELSFKEIEVAILNNIEDLHWSDVHQMYCDSSIDQEDEPFHVCHKGYLSLFPFLLALLPPSSAHLGSILDLLHDPQHLWSPYGLRSLSASHPEYGRGENYWKGPIWIQMNYLALRALHQTYAAQEGPHQERAKMIYSELRQRVVNNVFEQYEQTGYVWEQYDGNSGAGKRSHPFTGWTSLVALILAEKY